MSSKIAVSASAMSSDSHEERLLLSFDAYFKWWFPYEDSIKLDATLEQTEDRALENMQTATDMYEMYERVSINSHKSFLLHAAVFKTTKDILEVKDVHNCMGE